MQHIEFEHEYKDGDSFIVDLVRLFRFDRDSGAPMSEIFRWILREHRSELREETLRPVVAFTLRHLLNLRDTLHLANMMTILDISLNDIDSDHMILEGTITDAVAEQGDISTLQYVMRGGNHSLASYTLLNFLVGLGADVYRLGYGEYMIQSPTTLAMRCSTSLYLWRATLIENEYCLHCFVLREMQTSPLVNQGWTRDTLLALFMYGFKPIRCCPDGMEPFRFTCRHLEWNRKLEMIKLGQILDVQQLDHQRGTDGTSSRSSTKKSCLKCGHATSATVLTELIESQVQLRNEDFMAYQLVDSEDKWKLYETDYACMDWNPCGNSRKAQEEMVLQRLAKPIDYEEEEEYLQPRMPGGFHL
jgi:hypothetical protein